MVPELPPDEDAMPLPADLDPAADQAIAGLLRAQPGLAIPEPVQIRILSALRDEAATRAALYGNDAEPTPSFDPFVKPVRHQPSPAVPLSDAE